MPIERNIVKMLCAHTILITFASEKGRKTKREGPNPRKV